MNARKNTFKKVALKPIAAGVALAAAGVAQAQPMLEEVIVTAQKRVESLQDVPISVSAVSGQTMDDANHKTFCPHLVDSGLTLAYL